MIDWLVARASARALALSSLIIHMELAGGRVYRRVIRPATPTAYRKFLLKLLQLEIAAHPPQAEVLRLTLTAEADQSSTMQLDLFAPQTPEPSRLDVTIARLKAIAGEDRVGSPVLEDSHRPGSFCMENFAGAANSAPASSTQSASALHAAPCAACVLPFSFRWNCASTSPSPFATASAATRSKRHTDRGAPAAAGGLPMAGMPRSGTCC